MDRDLVVAIDQGTTGTTVLLVDAARTVRGRGYREFAQIYPRPGEVEHDPEAVRNGHDPQLERAVQEILAELAKTPPKTLKRPTFSKYQTVK